MPFQRLSGNFDLTPEQLEAVLVERKKRRSDLHIVQMQRYNKLHREKILARSRKRSAKNRKLNKVSVAARLYGPLELESESQKRKFSRKTMFPVAIADEISLSTALEILIVRKSTHETPVSYSMVLYLKLYLKLRSFSGTYTPVFQGFDNLKWLPVQTPGQSLLCGFNELCISLKQQACINIEHSAGWIAVGTAISQGKSDVYYFNEDETSSNHLDKYTARRSILTCIGFR